MDIKGTILFLLLFLFAAYWLWTNSACLDDLRNWFTICKEFASAHGLTIDPETADTSIRFFGNYDGFCFKFEVVLVGGCDAVPPELNLRITINNVGRMGDSFEISEAHFLSRKQFGFGIPDLDQDYVASSFLGKNYGNLFTTPSFCASILKYHPNVLSLAKQELSFSKWVTEKQLEELWVYSNFLLHIGKQINRFNDVRETIAEERSTGQC